MQYISKFESDIKPNPKSFWRYVKPKRGCSNIPASMFLGEKSADDTLSIVNLYVEFFDSNFVPPSNIIPYVSNTVIL